MEEAEGHLTAGNFAWKYGKENKTLCPLTISSASNILDDILRSNEELIQHSNKVIHRGLITLTYYTIIVI